MVVDVRRCVDVRCWLMCWCYFAGSDPLSPVANKRRRTQFTSTGPSRFSTGRASDNSHQRSQGMNDCHGLLAA